MFVHKANRISELDETNIQQNMNQNTCKSGRKPVPPAEHVSKSTGNLGASAASRTCPRLNEQVSNQCHLESMSHSQQAN